MKKRIAELAKQQDVTPHRFMLEAIREKVEAEERADAPKLTPSMSIALSDLRFERLYVVFPGTRR